ncbi:hypothetical protein ACIBVL_40185 [Streptomyces sp. NPDC049687]|uniref:hypothetical protein n=1 Tax=Streptomyces sp. NPDC049687 TaxID=3365596 RepID=UPI0037A2EB1E
MTSTSTGKHAKPYVSGSEAPGESSETDVPADAKPAQPAAPCPGGLDACETVYVATPAG